MKKILLILIAGFYLISCKSGDQKNNREQNVNDSIRADRNIRALKDSSNYTTIQWLDSNYLDMGKVKEGQIVEVAYRFKNTGNKNLIITDVSAGCGCTITETPKEPFAPGQEGVIRAKFNSQGRKGENRKDIYVTANTRPNYQALSFRVEVTD